jgi:hypothetical protein
MRGRYRLCLKRRQFDKLAATARGGGFLLQ